MYKTLDLHYRKTLFKSRIEYYIYLKNDKHIHLYYLKLISNTNIQLRNIDYIDKTKRFKRGIVDCNEFDEVHNFCNPFLENDDKLKTFVSNNPILYKDIELYFEFSVDKDIKPPKKICLEVYYDYTSMYKNGCISHGIFYEGSKKYTNEIIKCSRFFRYLGFVLCLKENIDIEYIQLRFKKGGILSFDLFDTYPKTKNGKVEYILPIYKNINELLHIIKHTLESDIDHYLSEIDNDNKIAEVNRIMRIKNNSIQSIIIDGKEKKDTEDIFILVIVLHV